MTQLPEILRDPEKLLLNCTFNVTKWGLIK